MSDPWSFLQEQAEVCEERMKYCCEEYSKAESATYKKDLAEILAKNWILKRQIKQTLRIDKEV